MTVYRDLSRFSMEVVRSLLILGVATVLFWLTLSVSAVGFYRDIDPRVALKWVPSDAGAQARQAVALLADQPTLELREESRALAKASITRDLTSVIAFRALGVAANGAGDGRQAFRYMRLGERLSRRDQPMQHWLISHYQRAGDVPRMIHHFDAALRTSTRGWDILLPVLAGLSADPRVAATVRPILDQDPQWRFVFMHQLAASGANPRTMVTLARGMLDPDIPSERDVIVNLIARLVSLGDYEMALQAYHEVAGMPRDMLAMPRGGDFEARNGFAPFDWELAQEPELSGVRRARPDSEDGSVLGLVANNGRAGTVARQMIRLSTGSYRLSLEMGDVPIDVLDRPQITIICAAEEPQRTLLDVRPAQSWQGARRIEHRFSVVPGCDWQWLSISLSGQGPPTDTVPWIDNVVIRPAVSR